MFGDRIAIGHAGDIIADEPRAAHLIGADLGRCLRPFGRHQIRGHEKPGKKIADDQARLVTDADQPLMPVHVRKQKLSKSTCRCSLMPAEKPISGRALRPHVVHACDPRRGDPPAALRDGILDKIGDEPAHKLMNGTNGLEARIKRRDLAANATQKIDLANLRKIDEPGAQAIVDIMRIIGDVVGERRRLCLGAGKTREVEILDGIIFEDRRGKSAFGIARGDLSIGLQKRSVVFDEPFQCLPSQIEPVEGGVAAFELGDDPQRLGVVIEAAVRRHELVEHLLARVAERRVAKIMRERQRFGEIVVEAERAGKRARDLADFERMGEPGAEMIALMRNKDLCLMGEPAEGRAMNDAVAIALKFRARRRRRAPRPGGRGFVPHRPHKERAAWKARAGEIWQSWHEIWLTRTHSVAGGRFATYVCISNAAASASHPTSAVRPRSRQASFEVFKMSEAAIECPVELTEKAARRVAEILKSEPAGSFLRVGVDGGGCSGFTYTYNISTEQSADDLVIERDGATVAIDPISLDILRGSKIDFIDDLMGRMFKIVNPAATASCGCGSSFAV